MGLAGALSAEDDIRVVGQPHTPNQLLNGLNNFRPQVLVLSSAFLGCIDVIKVVCAQQGIAILLLEDYGEEKLPQLVSGVHGVMRRSADERTVVHSIRQLSRGGRVVCLARSSSQDGGQDSVGVRVRQRLSSHELGIVSHVVHGFKNREIAIRMGTSEQSIKNRLRKIFDKTGVYGRLELALFVLHHRALAGTYVDTHPESGPASMASLQRHWGTRRIPNMH